MPISIKNTLMSYKKSNGDYVNVDAISDNNSKIIYAACTGIITNPNKPTEGSYNRRQININVPENYVAEVDHYIIITFPVNEYYVPQQLYAVHFNYLGNNTDSDVRVSGLGNLNVLNSESTIFDEGSPYLFRYSADLTWKIIGYRSEVQFNRIINNANYLLQLTKDEFNRTKGIADMMDGVALDETAQEFVQLVHDNAVLCSEMFDLMIEQIPGDEAGQMILQDLVDENSYLDLLVRELLEREGAA